MKGWRLPYICSCAALVLIGVVWIVIMMMFVRSESQGILAMLGWAICTLICTAVVRIKGWAFKR